MEHVGMDLGKRESQIAIITEAGELVEKRAPSVGQEPGRASVTCRTDAGPSLLGCHDELL
jgi:hypothetical protein